MKANSGWYTPRYYLGDRVRGVWRGIPFAGTAAIDHDPSGSGKPQVVVNLDLPVKVDGQWYTMIQVEHRDLLDKGESYGVNSKTNRKKSAMGSN